MNTYQRSLVRFVLIMLTLTALMVNTNKVVAQPPISVERFTKLDNDLTARIAAPVRDRNNDLTALLKMVTNATGFDFDGGSIGIEKIEYKVGEVWVYIPEGSRAITIAHPQFKLLRNYTYPMPIEAGAVYEMVLAHGELITVVKEQPLLSEFVVIDSEPSGADLYLNGTAVGKTPFVAEKPEGSYEWRIEQELYKSVSGQFNLKAGDKVEFKEVLKPNFGSINLSSKPENGANISINGVDTRMQTPSFIDRLPVGTHTITLRHEWYDTKQIQVQITAESHENESVTLVPTYGMLTVTTDSGARILINDNEVGEGRWEGRLKPGVCKVEVEKQGHTNEEKRMVIQPGDRIEASLFPKPIYGALRVISEPLGADVYVNGKKKGITPLIVRDLLIGQYKVKVVKKNVGEAIIRASVTENEVREVKINLNDKKYSFAQAKPVATPSRNKYRHRNPYESGLLIGLNFYRSLPLTASRRLNSNKEVTENWLNGNVGLGKGRGMGLTFNYVAFEEVYAVGFAFEMNYLRYFFQDTEQWQNLLSGHNEYESNGMFDSIDLGLGISVNREINYDVYWNTVFTCNFVVFDFQHHSAMVFRDSQNEYSASYTYRGWARGSYGTRFTLSSTVSLVALQVGLRTSLMNMKDIETESRWNTRNQEGISFPGSRDKLRVHTVELVLGIVLGQPL